MAVDVPFHGLECADSMYNCLEQRICRNFDPKTIKNPYFAIKKPIFSVIEKFKHSLCFKHSSARDRNNLSTVLKLE